LGLKFFNKNLVTYKLWFEKYFPWVTNHAMPCPYKGFPKLALLANINNASHDEPLVIFLGISFHVIHYYQCGIAKTMQGKVGRLWPINSLALTIWCSMQHQHTSCYSITSRNYHSTFTCLANFIFKKKCQILRKLRSLLAEKLENYYLLKPKFVYQCFLWAWQWSLMENYIILPHGFLNQFPFWFCVCNKSKK